MASTEDLVYGHGLDDALGAAAEQVGTNRFDEEPAITLAALIALDDRFGLSRVDDYVLVAPGYAMWLWMSLEVLDPDIAARLEMLAECGDNDPRIAELDALIASRPFEVQMVTEYEPPPFMVGRVFRIRVMNEAQTRQLPAMVSVRANGDVISLPRGGMTNVNDL
jgi:hypothetical protein